MNTLTPFLLNEKPVRGRVVRLESAVDTVLRQHDYPPRISALLGETLVMAAMLSSNLKADGVVTIQLQSKGALSLLVADATADGRLRGYAQFDEEADLSAPLPQLCREGHLAITLDRGGGEGGGRYQGVVPLEGSSIAETIQHYFTHSQQLRVECKLAVGEQLVDGVMRWIAGGIYIELMPEHAEASADSEEWREACVLLQTLRNDELLDSGLPTEQLLFRLFHEGGVWVYDPHTLRAECRCNRDRIARTLGAMDHAALKDMADEGRITVDCQFCGKQEIFALDELTVAG